MIDDKQVNIGITHNTIDTIDEIITLVRRKGVIFMV